VTTTYDIVRYPSWPVTNTHPSRIAAYAKLLGHPFKPFETSRVLEIGCGDGLNLMSMAVGAPQASFTGLDLAEAPIAYGCALAEAANIKNVTLKAQDVTKVGKDLGAFDYIIAHGIYAWVPDFVREAIMQLIGDVLAPDGLAFVSYNVEPGCKMRHILRDLMLSRMQGTEEPQERIAHAHDTLKTFIDIWDDEDPFQKALKTEALDILKRVPAQLFHDELGPCWEPQKLSAVVERAKINGLEYLCDMRSRDIATMFSSPQPMTTEDWLHVEQSHDFAEMRRFRQSIFCRAGTPIDRKLDASRLSELWATASLTRVDHDEHFVFATANGDEFETGDPQLADFLSQLGAAFPLSVSCAAVKNNPMLAEALLALFSKSIIELVTAPLPARHAPDDFPLVSPLARVQIERGEVILASLRHKPFRLDDEQVRQLFCLLDGTHSHSELIKVTGEFLSIPAEQAEQKLATALAEFTKLGLMQIR